MENKLYILVLVCLLFAGCEMIEYHPYDGRISGETNINVKNIRQIEEKCAGKDTIRFAFVTDTQRWYDETELFVDAVNQRTDIDFVIHGGDIADFGLTKEFLWMRDILNKLSMPYAVILGNHDCLANGKDIYNEVFGEENFAFVAGETKFICLNTNALEFDYSHPVPDFNFIEAQHADKRDYKKTVFAMHVRPFSEQFNNNIAKAFQYAIRQFPDLQFCLNGHDHQLTADDLFEDGLMYYGAPNIKDRTYLLFTLTPDQYIYEVVEF